MSNKSLKERTAKGLLWGGLGNGILQVLNLVFGIFLARLLTPADYGMVGMLAIFSAVAGTIQESGFTNALVNKQDITHKDYNAVFWFSTIAGVTLYIILFFCAPLIANYYNQPELTRLSRIYFLGFVISSTATSHNAYLFRNLMTKEKAIAQAYAISISCIIGIIMAYNNMGYWGLTIQSLIYVSIINLSFWYFSSWRPSIEFDFRPLKQFFSFSVKILLTNIFTQINNNIFSTIIGLKFTPHSVGLYTQANKWNNMGSMLISGTINSVAQPVMSQTCNDRDRLLNIFRKMLRFTSYLSFPAMFGLAFIAPEFIFITLKEKWMACVQLLQILCIWGAFLPITTLCSNLFISKGKSNLNLINNVSLGLIQILILLISYKYGIVVMITIYVIINLLWMFFWYFLVKKETGLKFHDALKDISLYALASIAAIAISSVITRNIESVFLVLISKIFITATLYTGLLWLLKSKIQKEVLLYIFKKRVL